MALGRAVLLPLLAALLAVGSGTAHAADLTPQAIISALRSDPSYLPNTPNYVEYQRGAEQPVSQPDRDRGMLAYFTVAVNFKTAEVTSGITYRVFRDEASAERYLEGISIANNPNFKSAPGAGIFLDPYTKDDWRWRGPRPFDSAFCESFIGAGSPNLVDARCSAQYEGRPVIVTGIRIEPVQFQGSGKDTRYLFGEEERNKQYGHAMGLLDAGMERVIEIEAGGRFSVWGSRATGV